MGDRVALARRAFVNRCSENIYKAYSAIFSEHRLHVTVDNWGVYRASATNAKWSTGLAPHWDLNPWRFLEDMGSGFDPGYQGLVALTDQTVETGCHMTLPGCTKFMEQWCRERVRPEVSKTRSLSTRIRVTQSWPTCSRSPCGKARWSFGLGASCTAVRAAKAPRRCACSSTSGCTRHRRPAITATRPTIATDALAS